MEIQHPVQIDVSDRVAIDGDEGSPFKLWQHVTQGTACAKRNRLDRFAQLQPNQPDLSVQKA